MMNEMFMETIIIMTIPGVFLVFLVYYLKSDNVSERQTRDCHSRSFYQNDHRQRKSINQKAGHVYDGDEFGPFGKAVSMTLGICSLIIGFFLAKTANFQTFGFVVGAFPVYTWHLFVSKRMGWQ